MLGVRRRECLLAHRDPFALRPEVAGTVEPASPPGFGVRQRIRHRPRSGVYPITR